MLALGINHHTQVPFLRKSENSFLHPHQHLLLEMPISDHPMVVADGLAAEDHRLHLLVLQILDHQAVPMSGHLMEVEGKEVHMYDLRDGLEGQQMCDLGLEEVVGEGRM